MLMLALPEEAARGVLEGIKRQPREFSQKGGSLILESRKCILTIKINASVEWMGLFPCGLENVPLRSGRGGKLRGGSADWMGEGRLSSS